MNARVDALFRRLGAAGDEVTVEISADDSVLAMAQGGTLPGNIPMGKIVVSTRLLRFLTHAELEFVLGHEVTHIWKNHLVATAPFAVVRAAFDQQARRDSDLRALLVLWDMFKVVLFAAGDLPPDAATLKSNEEEADLVAVLLTGDRAAAHSALSKLVGGDMTAASHTWEVFQTEIPAMTMGRRLASLDANLRRNGLL